MSGLVQLETDEILFMSRVQPEKDYFLRDNGQIEYYYFLNIGMEGGGHTIYGSKDELEKISQTLTNAIKY
ncbi:MAG TPA: hypothetical protein PKD00_01655 [Burkholderiales bacterium]|nr:hypothetical protein [Burkholderiales bacterium]